MLKRHSGKRGGNREGHALTATRCFANGYGRRFKSDRGGQAPTAISTSASREGPALTASTGFRSRCLDQRRCRNTFRASRSQRSTLGFPCPNVCPQRARRRRLRRLRDRSCRTPNDWRPRRRRRARRRRARRWRLAALHTPEAINIRRQSAGSHGSKREREKGARAARTHAAGTDGRNRS